MASPTTWGRASPRRREVSEGQKVRDPPHACAACRDARERKAPERIRYFTSTAAAAMSGLDRLAGRGDSTDTVAPCRVRCLDSRVPHGSDRGTGACSFRRQARRTESHSHKPELARGFRPCPLERVGAPVRLYSRLYCLLCTSRSFGLQWCLWLTQTKQRICEKIAPRDAASGLRLQAGRSGAGGVGINQSFLSRSDLYVGAVTSAPASARPGGMCARTGPYVQRLATASSLS